MRDEARQDLIDQLVVNAHSDLAVVQSLAVAHPELINAPARWGETAIQAAAQMGRADIADYLLLRGAPLDICTAAMLGRAETVGAMVGADRSLISATGAHGIPLLYFAVIKGHTGLTVMLQEVGASPIAPEGVTSPLHGAALFDQPEMAAWLLRAGALRAAHDADGKTALQLAEEHGHARVVAVLAPGQ
jgi:uncharacterized protein